MDLKEIFQSLGEGYAIQSGNSIQGIEVEIAIVEGKLDRTKYPSARFSILAEDLTQLNADLSSMLEGNSMLNNPIF
jgi:hypothetical protein